MTQKLIWNKICKKRRSLSLYRDGYRVDHRCLSLEVSTLIGSQLDSGMAIMWEMRSQVFCFFDVAAARRRCWFCCNLHWIPLKSMDQLKIDSCSEFECYRKMNFILLFSESHRSPWHKIWIDTIISWGAIFISFNNGWILLQFVPKWSLVSEESENIKIFAKFTVEVGKNWARSCKFKRFHQFWWF